MLNTVGYFFLNHTLSFDILVWTLIARGVASFISASLMLQEPMDCGGSNTPLHRMLAAVLFTAGISAFNRAFSRMEGLVHQTGVLRVESIIFSELLVTTAIVLLACRLGYDYYRFVTRKNVTGCADWCDRDCPK